MPLSPFRNSPEYVPVNRWQGIIPQLGVTPPAHLKGAYMTVRQAETQPVEFSPQEGHIESCIVSDQDTILDECLKSRVDNFRHRSINEHVIRNAVDLFRPLRYLFLDMNHAMEPTIDNSVPDRDSSNLYDPVSSSGIQACSLDIKDRIFLKIHCHL